MSNSKKKTKKKSPPAKSIKPKIIISSFPSSPKKKSLPMEFEPNYLKKHKLPIPLIDEKHFYPAHYIRKEDLTKTDCGIVYSFYKKGTTEIKGFIIGEKHQPVMECQVIQLQKFIYFADIIFTEYNLKEKMRDRNSLKKHNDLLVLSNYIRFNQPGKNKYFLEKKSDCIKNNELNIHYTQQELTYIVSLSIQDYINLDNNPLNFLELVKFPAEQQKIRDLYSMALNYIKINDISKYQLNLDKISNIYLGLGIIEYFIPKNKKNIIDYAKDKKEENTAYGIMKSRNEKWYNKFKSDMSKPKNKDRTFLIVVGLQHLIQDELGFMELLSSDYDIRKVDVEKYYGLEEFIDLSSYELSLDNPNLNPHQNIEYNIQ